MRRIILLISLICLNIGISVAADNHDKPHHAGIFLGGTTNTDIPFEFHFTAGIDYEYRFLHTTPNVGVGFIGEIVLADHTEYIAALPLFIHPWQGLKVFFAPGYITASESQTHEPTLPVDSQTQKFKVENQILAGAESGIEENISHSSSHFFVRFGAAYDFHYHQYSITPTISADIIESTVYVVYGIGFGIGF